MTGEAAFRSSTAVVVHDVETRPALRDIEGSAWEASGWLGTYRERLRLAYAQGLEQPTGISSEPILLANARLNWLPDR